MVASGHSDITETVLDSFQKHNPNNLDVDTQAEFEVWWNHQPAKPTGMMNYYQTAKVRHILCSRRCGSSVSNSGTCTWTTQFDPLAGLLLAIDGIVRAPNSLCKVVYSLSPPGNYYSKTRKISDNVHFTHAHNWTSSRRYQSVQLWLVLFSDPNC